MLEDLIIQLNNIDDRLIEGDLITEAEVDSVFELLEHENTKIVTRAAVILTNLDMIVLQKLMDQFNTYPESTRILLIPMLAGTEFYKVFKFLFETLKSEPEGVQASIIETCLSKTEYAIFPLILFYLHDAKGPFLYQLKRLLIDIGFDEHKDYLAMLPEIPHERIFRDVYGDEKIDSLR